MEKKLRNGIFLGLIFALLLSLPVSLLLKKPRQHSYTENRDLTQFQPVTIEGITSGEFQENFSQAVSDQSYFRDQALQLNSRLRQLLSRWSYAVAGLFQKAAEPDASNHGDAAPAVPSLPGKLLDTFSANALYEMDGEDYLIQLPFTYEEDVDQAIAQHAKEFGVLHQALPDAVIIVDAIELAFLSAANPLNAYYPQAVAGRYVDTLQQNLPQEVVGISQRFSRKEELLQAFYRTDHHFKASLAKEVYHTLYQELSLCGQLGPELELTEFEVPNSVMMGSKARAELYDGIQELLTDLQGELPLLEVYINGKSAARSDPQRVTSGELMELAKENGGYQAFYSEYFGYDYGEVKYVNPQAENDRCLLLIGPSYTQTFEKFLASHYSRCYVVDPRHYAEDMGESFHVIDYARRIGADDIVYFIQPQYLAEDVWQVVPGGEK